MSQITESSALQMLRHADANEHSPLTVWEEKQLALTWLAHDKAISNARDLMRFYSVDTLAELIGMQERHIERLQAKLARSVDNGAPVKMREG